ncbi:MAG: hypothetical protein BGO01_20295 [Armatimonadetes bacterium 55-13]|nr:DUF1080 domain-containing protein [Armatimonadota bacterium]OJU64453.1 MAG: hypothetical protein BGO01_20295 [Armatimonadetes bacterium 55-13]
MLSLTACFAALALASSPTFRVNSPGMANDIVGRWDVVVHGKGGTFPTWFQINDDNTGSFVGQVGSARPIREIKVEGDNLVFILPPQYEGRKDDMRFEGKLDGGALKGTTTDKEGETISWEAKKAPALPHREVKWGTPVELIGADLSNWTPRSPNWESHWSIEDGQLVNAKAGSDLVTKQKFSDFKLVCEYKYPEKSNSGIYLRGRYEIQILDDYGQESTVGTSAAVYGFIRPTENAVKPHGEWNTCEIELIGRWITIVLNGKKVVDHQEIPGITGGALDCNEGEPGPLFLQGDHGPVTFRKVTLTPAE